MCTIIDKINYHKFTLSITYQNTLNEVHTRILYGKISLRLIVILKSNSFVYLDNE